MSFKSFEELDCWKAAREVRLYFEKLIKKLPVEEKYDLIDNARRAARSATRNIAEGFGRFHFQENIQFCRQSRGSQHELIDDLITCMENKYISSDEYSEGRKLLDKSRGILNGYINYLENAKINYASKVGEPQESYNL